MAAGGRRDVKHLRAAVMDDLTLSRVVGDPFVQTGVLAVMGAVITQFRRAAIPPGAWSSSSRSSWR